MQTVYLETTIPSYLAARRSSLRAMALRQDLTHQWWSVERHKFYLYCSVFVADEASAGDSNAAQRRMEFLQGVPLRPVTSAVQPLASSLAALLKLPRRAVIDAAHLAMSIIHRMDFLLTWNCTHLANPVLQREIIEFCNYHDLHVPVICTPELLTERLP